MFEQINKELQQLKQDAGRYHKLESMLKSLRTQLEEQKQRQRELEEELQKENLDVEKISKMSFSAILHTVLGNREEKIEQERQEALAAQLKYDNIKRQIEDTLRQISKLQSEKIDLNGCESRYNELFEKKLEMLRQSGSRNASGIIELENRISSLEANLKEISEAISAGESVVHSLERAEGSLGSAENWGTWDMWGGGGLVTNIIKHGHIDDARDAASEVQTLLNRFRTELADVRIDSRIEINIDGFDKFADFFFDGLIADWFVQSEIHESQESVSKVKSEVCGVLNKLSRMRDSDKNEIARLESDLSRIVAEA